MDFWSPNKYFRWQAENVNKVILIETNNHPLSHNPELPESIGSKLSAKKKRMTFWDAGSQLRLLR